MKQYGYLSCILCENSFYHEFWENNWIIFHDWLTDKQLDNYLYESSVKKKKNQLSFQWEQWIWKVKMPTKKKYTESNSFLFLHIIRNLS